MGNQKLRKALITFFIISLVCIVGYIGASFSYAFFAANSDFNATLQYYTDRTNLMMGAFMFPFASGDLQTQFADFYTNYAVEPIVMSIVILVATALLFVLLIIGLVRVFAKRRGGFAFYAFAWLAILYIVAVGLSSESTYLFVDMLTLFNGSATDYLIVSLATAAFVFSVLAVVMAIITYILGMKYAGVKKEAEEVEAVFETEQPVLSEENLAPEETQDVVAETNPDYVAVVEPEPQPDSEPVEEEPEEVQEEPAAEEPEEVQEEPQPVEYVEPEPIPEPQPDETNNHVEVNVNNNPAPQAAPAGIDPNSLASLLREVVRDIVRDEIARNNANQPRINEDASRNGGNQTITGATFGGPLVVQYFNGGINGVNPSQPVVEAVPAKEEPKPAPVEEKKEEPKPAPVEEAKPAPVEEKKEEPQPAPAPAPEVVTPVEAPASTEEKPVYERLSFTERLLQADQEILDLYNELKNEILSYGVKSRISAVGDTFRLHKKMYVRITVAGKSLKLYFALNPEDYKDSKIPVQDAGHKGLYAEIPLVFKVRSGLSVRRCKELIQDTMEKDGLEQGEVGKVNWIKELQAELKEKAKKGDEDED